MYKFYKKERYKGGKMIDIKLELGHITVMYRNDYKAQKITYSLDALTSRYDYISTIEELIELLAVEIKKDLHTEDEIINQRIKKLIIKSFKKGN